VIDGSSRYRRTGHAGSSAFANQKKNTHSDMTSHPIPSSGPSKDIPVRLWLASLGVLVSVMGLDLTKADVPARVSTAEFDALHQLIRPAPGESRWMEIDWFPTIWEAQQRAALEGKPLFIWAGSGGAPAAGC